MLFPAVLGWYKDAHRHLSHRLDRDDLMLWLKKNGVETRTMFPLITQPCYKDWLGPDAEKDYPVASWVARSGLCLPCHDGMSEEDVHYVCDLIDGFLQGRAKL